MMKKASSVHYMARPISLSFLPFPLVGFPRMARLFLPILTAIWSSGVGAEAFAQEKQVNASSERQVVSAEDVELKEKYLQEFLQETQDQNFVYKREGRADPFVPFVTEVVVKAEIEETEEDLAGLRKFEPGQLSLVAIVLTNDDQPFAMVQDQTGRGYVVKRNDKIGKYGIVDDIMQNKVTIAETRLTQANTKQVKTIEMILRKEGEK